MSCLCVSGCGMPPVVSSGIFNSSGTNLINDTATLECDDGYTLSSVDMADAVITCQASGDWTASGSTCIKSKYLFSLAIGTLYSAITVAQ